MLAGRLARASARRVATSMASGDNTYWLDQNDRIVGVADGWDAFATENGGEAAAFRRIQEKPIREFIADDVTRMWFDVVLQLARIRQTPVERSYRCDTPACRRMMNMCLSVEPSGLIRVEHSLVATTQRPHSVFINHARYAEPGSTLHTRCSICGRIQRGESWIEPDAGTAPGQPALAVVYSVCQECSLGILT